MRVFEAVELLLEIVTKCGNLDGGTFMLMPPKPHITVAEGYKIHVARDSGIDKETFACVESIARKRDLSFFEDARGIMLYRKH